MLAALLADLPVELIERGIVPDSRDDLGLTFASLSAAADLIVTTGGASVGDHDLVRPALLAAGGSVDYWRRSEENTSELQSLMRISYAVFCLKKKINLPSSKYVKLL